MVHLRANDILAGVNGRRVNEWGMKFLFLIFWILWYCLLFLPNTQHQLWRNWRNYSVVILRYFNSSQQLITSEKTYYGAINCIY